MLRMLAALLAALPSPPDTLPPHVVRQLPAVEVTAGRLNDLHSTETAQLVTAAALRDLPLDGLAGAVALQPGVVATGQDLHVRGGRAGELQLALEGLPLNDPLTGTAPELPLLAVRDADLLDGALAATHAGALAGVLETRTWDAPARWQGAARWSGDGQRDGGSDWAGARLGGPVPRTALALALAGEARLDNLGLPLTRTRGHTTILGRSFGWRADNHLLAWAKLAPRRNPGALSLQVFGGRVVEQPYDPMFTFDDSVRSYFPALPPIGGVTRADSTPPLDSVATRYRAADHLAMTETRRLALVAAGRRRAAGGELRAAFAWTRERVLQSVGLEPDPGYVTPADRIRFGGFSDPRASPFLAYAGDEPYFRRSLAERWQAQLAWRRPLARGQALDAGLGALVDAVQLYELDDGAPKVTGVDTLRAFSARAPGGWAFVQHHWESAGLQWDAGLRAQVWTAGSQGVSPAARAAARLAGVPLDPPRAQWTWSPRLAFSYPVSTRDAFSLAYTRIHQPPDREFLYESRVLAYDRRPLGNTDLAPAEVISWQVALKHLFAPPWALQLGLFYRDVYGEVGVRDDTPVAYAYRPRYDSVEDGHAMGFEVALLAAGPPGGAAARGGELSLRYTYLNAWGSLSTPDGWPYGPALGTRPRPVSDHPLDWDRRHVFTLDAAWRRPHAWTLAWVTQVASGAPWTPAVSYTDPVLGPVFTSDLAAVNSARLPWSEQSSLSARCEPPRLHGLRLLLEVRNVFDFRGPLLASLPGYPNPVINSLYDEYAGYRTVTGLGGGGFWNDPAGDGRNVWTPVHDPRLDARPRLVRLGIEAGL